MLRTSSKVILVEGLLRKAPSAVNVALELSGGDLVCDLCVEPSLLRRLGCLLFDRKSASVSESKQVLKEKQLFNSSECARLLDWALSASECASAIGTERCVLCLGWDDADADLDNCEERARLGCCWRGCAASGGKVCWMFFVAFDRRRCLLLHGALILACIRAAI
jgi:hypothetical protein